MRSYSIIVGSKNFFEISVQDDIKSSAKSFLELVRMSDAYKNAEKPFPEQLKADIMILKNDNYHGIVESAHDRLGVLVEELTKEDSEVYIHNPPAILRSYLENLFEQQKIELKVYIEEYVMNKDPITFADNMHSIQERLIGQEDAVYGISKSMWYLTNTDRKTPYVIMLYGGSSLGKTEIVREIAKCFFDNKFMEQHLSMYKNNNYSDYFFGASPNRRSLGFDLLERESNLIFLDELDKCPDYFYSAFYTLFDNTIFKDYVYNVDISGTLIILTSNYTTINEMKEKLGLPIFYRIDKFLYFPEFTPESIYQITMNEIRHRAEEYSNYCSAEEIYQEVCHQIQSSGENARTIKNKIQTVIEDRLFKKVQREYEEINGSL